MMVVPLEDAVYSKSSSIAYILAKWCDEAGEWTRLRSKGNLPITMTSIKFAEIFEFFTWNTCYCFNR